MAQDYELNYQVFLKNKMERNFTPIFKSLWRVGNYYCHTCFPNIPEDVRQDIVTEAIVEIYKREFPNFDTVKRFLYMCVSGRCKNHFRLDKYQQKQHRIIYKELSEIDEDREREQDENRIIFETEVLEKAYELAEQVLFPQEKKVFELCCIFENAQDVANILDISVQTVYNHRNRAIQNLKEAMSSENPGNRGAGKLKDVVSKLRTMKIGEFFEFEEVKRRSIVSKAFRWGKENDCKFSVRKTSEVMCRLFRIS